MNKSKQKRMEASSDALCSLLTREQCPLSPAPPDTQLTREYLQLYLCVRTLLTGQTQRPCVGCRLV